MRSKIYIGFYLILMIITTQAYSDCGDRNGFLWTFTWDDKACNRCREIGLARWWNCNSTDIGIHPIGITYTYEPPKSYFSPPKYTYKLRYGICHDNPPWSWWAWGSTGCDWIEYQEADMDNNKITSNLQDCKNDPNKFQQFSNPFFNPFNGKVCLVRESSNIYSGYDKIICAYFSVGGNDVKIGCQPYPRLPGPPPFTQGLFPVVSYGLQQITDASGFQSNDSFQRPLAIVNSIRGSDIISRTEIQLDLESSVISRSVGKFSTSIDINRPDKLIVMQDSSTFGEVPRPALEQSKSNMSFFPCYHTYLDQKKQAYQGVYVFSINKQIGDVIGDNLFLGPNYIPSNAKDQLGDVRVTRCDLCINAFEQNSSIWDTNIYNNTYKLKNSNDIGRCSLNNDVIIKKVKLVDVRGNSIVYPKKNICDGYTTIEAPVRVNALDYKFAAELSSCAPCSPDSQYCPDSNSKIFKYESDSAYLQHYLVSVKPVIPLMTNEFEADFVRAKSVNSPRCSSYVSDLQGKIYIKPSGKRDRTYCNGSDTAGVYPLCSAPSNDIERSACSGAYAGSANPDTDLPDKICIMSNGDWDFVSGRYQTAGVRNLNGDEKTVPKMSCTFLPACKSLGSDKITNIGNAIWDEDAAFGERKNGKCKAMSDNISNDDYIYRIKISSYTIDPSTSSDPDYAKAFEELATLKTNAADKPYINKNDLETKSYLKRFLGKNPNAIKCEIIKPDGRCIGGIYGDLTSQTDCVSVKEYDLPMLCTAN